jgi:uncharacterized glyoxalase superfamily protein PhnB
MSDRDPLDALHQPLAPLAPDPAFAAQLRHRIATALTGGDDQGGPMTTTDTNEATTAAATAAVRRPTLSPYLAVADARAAVAWYVEVFGGVAGETVEMPDGRLGHAEVRIGDATLMLADEFPEMNLLAPTSRGGTTVSVVVDVADVDATTDTARDAGATVEREPADMPYGFRAAGIIDPFGHRWLVEAPLAGAAVAAPPASSSDRPKPRTAHEVVDEHEVYTEPGDIVYVTWQVPDEERTARFLGELLGWTFTGGSVEHGLQVQGPNLMGGLWGKGEGTPIDAKLMYHVADIQAAVAKVRELGGTATDPELMPYGWSADCADDQGMEFWLYTPAEG